MCVPLQVEDRHLSSSLRMRRLAAAAPKPPIEYTPTWTLPNIDPMQVCRPHTHNGTSIYKLVSVHEGVMHASGQRSLQYKMFAIA